MTQGITSYNVRYTTRKGETRVYKYWKARRGVDGRTVDLGTFKTKREALARVKHSVERIDVKCAADN